MTKHNDTKARITKVAWKLFSEKGYNLTTVDDIILESGTSKGSFYHYFNSKDELLATVSEMLDNMYRELEKEIDSEMNSFDKLIEISCMVHKAIENDISLELISYLYSSQVVTKGFRHLLSPDRYYYELMLKYITEGQERNQITKEMKKEKILELYVLAERAIVYDYCICDGAYSLSEKTRELLPKLLLSIKA